VASFTWPLKVEEGTIHTWVGGARTTEVIAMPRATVILLSSVLLLGLAAATTQAETRRGDAGPDTFSGTRHKDWYWGRGGEDVLGGRGATDHLYGGRGADRLFAGRGADNVYGGRNHDRVIAGRGDDDFWGGRGDDYIRAGYGEDHLNGGPGNDTLIATATDGKADVLDCGSGDADVARLRANDNEVNCETVQIVS
jgi:Ca2+-binding RTX toxin-like protein